MLDNPTQLFYLFGGSVPTNPDGTHKGQCELDKNHQYKEGHRQSSKIPLLLPNGRSVTDLLQLHRGEVFHIHRLLYLLDMSG